MDETRPTRRNLLASTATLLADVFGVEGSVGPGPEGPTIRPHRPLDE